MAKVAGSHFIQLNYSDDRSSCGVVRYKYVNINPLRGYGRLGPGQVDREALISQEKGAATLHAYLIENLILSSRYKPRVPLRKPSCRAAVITPILEAQAAVLLWTCICGIIRGTSVKPLPYNRGNSICLYSNK